MTASLAYSATPVAELTGAQLTELSMAPLRELRRLAPGTTRTANRHDVRTGTTTAHSQPDGSVRYLEPARWSAPDTTCEQWRAVIASVPRRRSPDTTGEQ